MSRAPVTRRDVTVADHLGGTTRHGLFSGSLASLLSVACGVGITVALMDLRPRLLNLAPDFTWFRYVLLPATLSTIIISLAFLSVVLGLAVALRQRGQRATAPSPWTVPSLRPATHRTSSWWRPA